MKNKIIIKAELQQLSDSEIQNMIPDDTLNRIKQSDDKPLFKVFSVGHEGDANANVLGRGMNVLKYAREIIVQMFHRIKFGLPVFQGHDPRTNAHDHRQEIGEVAGKAVKFINNTMHTLTAIYIKPEFRDEVLDVASIEGNFEAVEKRKGVFGVVKLNSVTGVALSDGRVDTPGMPGATLQAALQMFSNRGVDTMDKKDVRTAILELKLKPDDLFSDDEILSMGVVKKYKENETEHATNLEKRLTETREENKKLQGDITKLNNEKATIVSKLSTYESSGAFTDIAKERNLSDKFKAFVEKNISDFKTDKTGDEFKTELGKFVDTQAKKYEDFAKLYGVDAEITNKDNEDKKSGDGKDKENSSNNAPSGDSQNSGDANEGIEDKYLDSKENDFIPD